MKNLYFFGTNVEPCVFNMHTVSCLWRLLEVSTFHSLLVGFKVNVMCAKCFIQVKLHKVDSAKGSVCVFLNSHHQLQSFVICLVNTKPKVMQVVTKNIHEIDFGSGAKCFVLVFFPTL